MNHSPLTLRRLNKQIAKLLRQCQLMTGKRLELVKSALGYLNNARRTYKRNLMISFNMYVDLATIKLRYANEIA